METPLIVKALTHFSVHFPFNAENKDFWKRIRIAISDQEMHELREYWKSLNPNTKKSFIHAFRGFPLHIEPDPTNLRYFMDFENQFLLMEDGSIG